MGLDSVELVMDMEKFFGIRILDADAEKMYTVQDAVDTIARYLNIESTDTALRHTMFSKVSLAIQQLTNQANEIQLNEKIVHYLPIGDKERWNKFEELLQLKVPRPHKHGPKKPTILGKLFEKFDWVPDYDPQMILFDQFADAICAHNYRILIDPKSLQTKHEIYIAVAGIAAVKIGVDNYEVQPGKAFTTDLGID